MKGIGKKICKNSAQLKGVPSNPTNFPTSSELTTYTWATTILMSHHQVLKNRLLTQHYFYKCYINTQDFTYVLTFITIFT